MGAMKRHDNSCLSTPLIENPLVCSNGCTCDVQAKQADRKFDYQAEFSLFGPIFIPKFMLQIGTGSRAIEKQSGVKANLKHK